MYVTVNTLPLLHSTRIGWSNCRKICVQFARGIGPLDVLMSIGPYFFRYPIPPQGYVLVQPPKAWRFDRLVVRYCNIQIYNNCPEKLLVCFVCPSQRQDAFNYISSWSDLYFIPIFDSKCGCGVIWRSSISRVSQIFDILIKYTNQTFFGWFCVLFKILVFFFR